ncbi:MAG: SLC13 family permease [Bacteroidota bacterium]
MTGLLAPDVLFIFFLLLLAIVLFANEQISFDVTALILLSSLLFSGILTPKEAFSGFSNSATITIACMFILSEGLRRSGILNTIGFYFTKLGRRNFWVATFVMMAAIGTISAFINNTAAVALFIPVFIGVAEDMKVSASKLLMPLSFASMFGGACTLIGTSTNILVSTIAQENGMAPFGMFEFTPLGLILTIVGFVYLFGFGIHKIPNRRGSSEELTKSFNMNAYLTDVIIEPDSPAVGKTIEQARLTYNLDLDVLRVFKKKGDSGGQQSEITLDPGDVVRIRGSVEEIDKLVRREDVSLKPTKRWYDIDLERGQSALVEAIIAPDSPLQNKKISEVNLYERFGAILLAIRQQGQLQQEHMKDIQLSAGDTLLLSINRERIPELEQASSFVLASEVGLTRFRTSKIPVALAILVGVVGLATFGLAPIVATATAGVVLMMLTGCVTTEEAYNAINWKVIVLLGGVLPFGIAMEKTGAAALISNVTVEFLGQFGPTVLLSGFFFLSMLLTNIISNQATAALLAPIAIEAASAVDVNARPFLIAVTLAASLSFMTPVGYQTNTLIYGPGQYKFIDFTKIGTPLNLILWVLASFLIPYFWPF